MSEIIERITAAIPADCESAIHLPELSAMLNMSPSTVKKCIKKARQQGTPILSGNNGYWLSESKEETTKYVLSMRKQALSRLSVIKMANNCLKGTDGQIKLFDEATMVNKM